MNNMFFIVILSFLIGGIFIWLLSSLLRKPSERLIKLIIFLPGIFILMFFIFGVIFGPENMIKTANIFPISAGVIMIFTIIYLYISKINIEKYYHSMVGTSIFLFLLLIISLPQMIFTFSNPFLSLLIYISLTIIGYYLITVKHNKNNKILSLKHSNREIIIRSFIGGAFITSSIIFALIFGPFWGAIISGIPTVFLSFLLINHWHYNSKALFFNGKNIEIGLLILIIHSVISLFTLKLFGVIGGILIAYFGSILVLSLINKINI